MTGQREPVDRALLAETVRLYGMAIEYRGQVFNPAEVVVHINGVTDSAKLSAAYQVMLRWQARNRGLETDRLFYEMADALRTAVREPAPVAVPVSCRYRTDLGSEYHVHADRSVSYHPQLPAQLRAMTADEIEAAAAAGHLTPFRVTGDVPPEGP